MKIIRKSKTFILIALASCALACLLFFSSLDLKIFDLFLRLLPPLTENEKVIVLALDDASMEYSGGFPFRREVMADVVVLLKELGVETIVFDLSYLDESARRFDPAYAEDMFVQHFNDEILSRMDVISIIPLLGRDVDDYFARALAFSGCSWLALTMFEHEITDSREIENYLLKETAFANVNNKGDTKTPQAFGVMPPIEKLLSRAKGFGFVNAAPDTDGLRRRVNLLLEYKDQYFKQLMLSAIKEKLGYNSIDVNNNFLTLNMNDGSITRIPRAQDGSVLLRWPFKPFNDYNIMSLVPLIQYTAIEPVLARNIAVMQESGFFYCWEKTLTPWDWYMEAEYLRQEAFGNNSPACKNWFFAKQEFYEESSAFLYGNYENTILTDFGGDYETEIFVREIFETCREQFERLSAIRQETKKIFGSFCIIGSDATSMTDLSTIAFQENYPNVGSYSVLANMLLSRDFIDDTQKIISLIIALVFCFVICFPVSRFDTHFSIITGVCGMAFLTAGIAVFFMITRIYLGLAVPLASLMLSFVTVMIDKYFTASNEKAFLHNAFSRYLSPQVIAEIINNPEKLNLGGEKREMTAIFTDIQDFSSISEQLEPVYLVRLLNHYLSLMSDIIMENIGTIDKYEGDAIMAFFGAPVFRNNHAVLACRSAVAMKAAEREFNKTVVQDGLSPIPIFTRIGINTGDMVVGNMGAKNKMDYTIMGNAVNIASRLEGVNKLYRTGGILISEYTRSKIGEEFLLRRLDRVRVVGINMPFLIYEILGMRNGELNIEYDIEQWEKAIVFYEKGDFLKAYNLFETLEKRNPDDRVAGLYAWWCRVYLENPPLEWDAVNNLTEK